MIKMKMIKNLRGLTLMIKNEYISIYFTLDILGLLSCFITYLDGI